MTYKGLEEPINVKEQQLETPERNGFTVVIDANHYAEHKEKPFFGELTGYITSAPVVAMVWQGDDCVTIVRKLVGATKVTESQPGTIRGDFGMHTNMNIIHASDSDESAAREIGLFFKPEEIIDWDDPMAKWI